MSEGRRHNARVEQILTAIKDKDSKAIKSLFSKKALIEANDFDDGIDYFFDFIQGDIDSWEKHGWAYDGSIKSGKKSMIIRLGVTISTDKDDYALSVIDYNMDTTNPDNEGVYMLHITRMADMAKKPSWQDGLHAGIYRPEAYRQAI